MLDISRFFKNHLANQRISSEELRQFAEDHIGKLRALPVLPSILTGLLAPTETAFGDFDKKLSDRTTYLAAQMGGTITKDEVLQLFRTTVRQREGRVRDVFPRGSAPYAEFFPKGLRDYNRARLGQLPGVLDRFITAADKYQADLGSELLAEFQALKISFASARDKQMEAKGDLAQIRANLAATRRVLEMQLGRNILAIASHHLDQPERAKDYFDQSLLQDPKRNNKGGRKPAPVV
jgi:hypothetical protein